MIAVLAGTMAAVAKGTGRFLCSRGCFRVLLQLDLFPRVLDVEEEPKGGLGWCQNDMDRRKLLGANLSRNRETPDSA